MLQACWRLVGSLILCPLALSLPGHHAAEPLHRASPQRRSPRYARHFYRLQNGGAGYTNNASPCVIQSPRRRMQACNRTADSVGAGKPAENPPLAKPILADIAIVLTEFANNVLCRGVAMKKILVIEDDTSLRVTIKAMLCKHGYEVLEAVNGGQGLEVARAQLPDLVLSDVSMAGLDGFGVRSEEHTSELQSLR